MTEEINIRDNAGKRVLIATFSMVPDTDQHTSLIMSSIKTLRRFSEVIDVVSLKGDILSHIERLQNARILRVPLNGDTIWEKIASFRRALQRQLESDNYDLVHIRSPIEGSIVIQLKEERGYKVLYEAATFSWSNWIHEICNDEEEINNIEIKLIREDINCASKADLVIVHSETAHQNLLQCDVEDKIVVIPYGVSLDQFDWEPAKKNQIPVLMVNSPLFGDYDLITVLDALSYVIKDIKVKLIWLGENDKNKIEKAREIAKQKNLEEYVRFKETVDWEKLPLYIALADICIVPFRPVSRYLTWGDYPISLLQYMSCKKPVIATRTNAIEEIGTEGIDLFLYTPGDSNALKNGILFLLHNPNYAKKLAERGYIKARNDYGSSIQRRKLLGTYRGILMEMGSSILEMINDINDINYDSKADLIVEQDTDNQKEYKETKSSILHEESAPKVIFTEDIVEPTPHEFHVDEIIKEITPFGLREDEIVSDDDDLITSITSVSEIDSKEKKAWPDIVPKTNPELKANEVSNPDDTIGITKDMNKKLAENNGVSDLIKDRHLIINTDHENNKK